MCFCKPQTYITVCLNGACSVYTKGRWDASSIANHMHPDTALTLPSPCLTKHSSIISRHAGLHHCTWVTSGKLVGLSAMLPSICSSHVTQDVQ